MKVFYESKLAKCLLLPGYSSITLGCFVFTKKSEAEIEQRVLNHEAIHVRQWKETTLLSFIVLIFFGYFGLSATWLLSVPFVYYGWYGIEYLFRVIYWIHKGVKQTTYKSVTNAAYRTLCFESEAYANELIYNYTDVRKFFEVIYYFR